MPSETKKRHARDRSSWPRLLRPTLLTVAFYLLVPFASASAFTEEDAQRGREVFVRCASCHVLAGFYPPVANPIRTRELSGGEGRSNLLALGDAPGSSGKLVDIADYISLKMPLSEPGTLSERQALDVTAWILKANGFRADGRPISREVLEESTLSEAFSPFHPARIAPWLGGVLALVVGATVLRSVGRRKRRAE